MASPKQHLESTRTGGRWHRFRRQFCLLSVISGIISFTTSASDREVDVCVVELQLAALGRDVKEIIDKPDQAFRRDAGILDQRLHFLGIVDNVCCRFKQPFDPGKRCTQLVRDK